jgi:hypothetical protein
LDNSSSKEDESESVPDNSSATVPKHPTKRPRLNVRRRRRRLQHKNKFIDAEAAASGGSEDEDELQTNDYDYNDPFINDGPDNDDE